ncbi:glutathione-S-transferase [Mycena rebaudengoi]|nr:glutathione-S-transferase [Mycena rebaudengoi]
MAPPDAQIFPRTTGAAVATVEAHKEPQELTFYAAWFCPFVQRSWICLEEKGIPYQYKEVNPYLKEKHFLGFQAILYSCDINPKGLVPAVEYRGKALYESLVISEFLEDAYPNHGPALLPADPYLRAYARIWMDFIGKSFLPCFFRLLQSQEVDKQDLAREEVYTALRTLAAEIKGPYFLGEELSLVDVAIMPWISIDYIIADHRRFKREDVDAKWKEYADHVDKRESLIKTKSDDDRYLEIYGRYLRDEAQSEAAKATRAGRAIP